ncbi:MAG: hypothetical protein ACI8O8_002627, partial [Oleiphilaceae bacterium]
MLVIKSKKISILSITMIFLLITAMSPHAMSEDQSEVVRKIVDTS